MIKLCTLICSFYERQAGGFNIIQGNQSTHTVSTVHEKSQLLFPLHSQPPLQCSITFIFEVPTVLNKEKAVNVNKEKKIIIWHDRKQKWGEEISCLIRKLHHSQIPQSYSPNLPTMTQNRQGPAGSSPVPTTAHNHITDIQKFSLEYL